jgi:hypothetical protein
VPLDEVWMLGEPQCGAFMSWLSAFLPARYTQAFGFAESIAGWRFAAVITFAAKMPL